MERPAEQLWRPRLALALLLSYFLLFGIVLGAQGVLWADVQKTLHVSDGVFGTTLLTAPLVAVPFLLSAGHLSAWAGKKRLALGAFAAWALANLALAAAGEVWALVGALALFGIGLALLETAANGATLDWEQATGRHVMNGMHAGYSGGAVIGALAAGALREGGWSHELVFASLTGLCGLAAVATLPIRYPPPAASVEGAAPGATLRLLLGPSVLTLLAVLCFLGIFGETVPNNWAVIYLKRMDASDFLAGAGFALFNLTMLLGRLANGTLVARFGARVSLLLSGAGLALSAALLLLPGGVPPSLAAFAVMGLATAGVVPTVLSAAARRVPGESGAITGAILAVTYASFILSPPLVGWLAELFASLRLAMLTVGVCGLAMLALAGRPTLRE